MNIDFAQHIDRTNLATGIHAEASLRAWTVLQYVREQHLADDAAGMADVLRVIRTKVPNWPYSVQRFLFRSFATIGETAREPHEAAR